MTARLLLLCSLVACTGGDGRPATTPGSAAGPRVDTTASGDDRGARIDYESDVAIATADGAGAACLAGSVFAPGTRLVLVGAAQPQTVVRARVDSLMEGLCPHEREPRPEPVLHARITADSALEAGAVYFAIVDRGFDMIVRDGQARGDLDGAERAEMFRSCTSAEGLHLSIWSGAPGSGIRRWHHYLYLGYDVEATCTDADFPESAYTASQRPAPVPAPPAVPAARTPVGPFEGIYSWVERDSAPLGIGRLHPAGDVVLSVPGGWTSGIALPLHDAPDGPLAGWIHAGWLFIGPERRPFDLAGMVETEYEDLSFIVTEMRDDGWLRFRYGPPSEPGAGLAWVHHDQLAIGTVSLAFEPWQERFTSDEIGPLHFRGDGPHALHAVPDPDTPPSAGIGRDHHLEPLEFRGDWLRVRVTEPSDYCAGEPIEVGVSEGWIRWWDHERGPLVWYRTRGC